MAEGGRDGIAICYQTGTEHLCEMCLEEDSFKQTMWYCKNCRQRLCDKCRKYHNEVASLKDHDVIRAEKMPPSQSTERLSDEMRIPMCNTHKNLPIEFYCEKHNQPVCNLCKQKNHKRCKRLRDLENVARENFGKSNEILEHLESIDHSLGEIEGAINSESQSMETQKENIIRKIKDKIQEIETLGYIKISEVEKTIEAEQNILQEEKDSLKKAQLLVSKRKGDMKTTLHAGSEEEIFIATINAEKEARKYQDNLNDNRYVTHKEFDFEVDTRLKDIDSFGSIELKNIEEVNVDFQPYIAEYFNPKSSLPIIWFDVLPEERVITLHGYEGSQHLSLYSHSTGLLSQLDLPGLSTASADTLKDVKIVVAISEKQCLLTVNIVNNKLITKETIKINGFPLLVQKYSEKSALVLAKLANGTFCFQILDLKGNVLTHIPISEHLDSPRFMRMSKNRDIFYLTDIRKGCYGFSLQRNVLFHYSQPNVKVYGGLAVDHHDCVYLRIVDQKGRHLTKLSPSGQCLQRRGSGYGCPLRFDSSKLYLVGKNAQNERLINYIFT